MVHKLSTHDLLKNKNAFTMCVLLDYMNGKDSILSKIIQIFPGYIRRLYSWLYLEGWKNSFVKKIVSFAIPYYFQKMSSKKL